MPTFPAFTPSPDTPGIAWEVSGDRASLVYRDATGALVATYCQVITDATPGVPAEVILRHAAAAPASAIALNAAGYMVVKDGNGVPLNP